MNANTTKMTALVVGGGIIGLSIAKAIRDNIGCRVILYSPLHPLDTTSAGAGGLWMPFHCEPAELVNSWSEATLKYLLDLKRQGNSVVETLEAFQFGTDALKTPPFWAKHLDGALNFRVMETSDLSGKIESQILLQNYSHAWNFITPIINSPKYLEYLLTSLESDPGTEIRLNENEFSSAEDIAAYASANSCMFAVNCSGLGSKDMLADGNMTPARGALLHFKRPKICNQVIMVDSPPVGSETRPAYIIPRGDIMVVGGTYLEGDSTDYVTDEEKIKIKNDAKILFPKLSESENYINTWVGFRPARSAGIRVDMTMVKLGNSSESIPLFHNYGHGGSGWTVFFGAANTTIEMIKQHFKESNKKSML